jgi:peroxiredoxin
MVRNIAAIVVLLVLIGGIVYGALGGKQPEQMSGPSPTAKPAASTAQVADKSKGAQEASASDAKTDTPGIKVGIREGNQAPDFTLETLNGKPLRLSDMRGKTVIMNVWATWCPPCRAEIPDMVAFYKEVQKKNAVILGVNLTETESSVLNVKRFVQGMGMQFPILLDKKSKVANMYQVTIIPTSFIIDGNGIIRKVVTGPMTKEQMHSFIQSK